MISITIENLTINIHGASDAVKFTSDLIERANKEIAEAKKIVLKVGGETVTPKVVDRGTTVGEKVVVRSEPAPNVFLMEEEDVSSFPVKKLAPSEGLEVSKVDGEEVKRNKWPACRTCKVQKPVRWMKDGVCSRCRGDVKN